MLFVSRDTALARQVEELLQIEGLLFSSLSNPVEIDAFVASMPPEIAVIDVGIGEDDALGVCASLRERVSSDQLAILFLVDEMDDAALSRLLATGADGLLSHSLKPLSLNARLAAHLARIAAGRTLALKVHDSQVLIDITSRLVGSADILENLYDVAELIAEELQVDRCSVVLVRPQRDFGLVVASSDNPNLRSLAINLKRYPEITSAVDNGAPLIVSDVADSNIFEPVLPNLRSAGVASVALFPIVRQGETLGVIFLRFHELREQFEEREVVFCQTVANAASIALRNAEILELLKAKTREVEKVQTEAADQLRNLKRYEDLFIGALDGMVALEQSGKTVFVNPRASEMIGADAADLVGESFAGFLVPEERDAFGRLLDEFVGGEARRSVDFHMSSSEESQQIISISAGSLFDEEGMMLLTMRDVTEERTTERRLAEAQRRLVQGEKQAAMAQLAGAAAHELNQPLTSVMTSLAILRRIDDRSEDKQRILDTMEQESERMASIIRRLTKITNYTTKQYVGDAQIVDLNPAYLDETTEEGDR